MKKTIRILSLALALVMLLCCAAFADDNTTGNPSTGNTLDESYQLDKSNAEIVFRLSWGVNFDPAHPYTAAATTFAETLYELSDGKIVCEYYPSAQLGDDASTLEQVMLGTLDCQVVSTPFTSAFTDTLYAVDLPYVFDGDLTMTYDILSSEIGQRMLDACSEDLGIHCLAWCYQPYRDFYTNKKIETADDLKGMKMRAMPNPLHQDAFTAMGMNPTTTSFNEIYTLMQQGGIDGWDSDPIGIITGGFYEVAKYVTISGHFNNEVMLDMSDNAWNRLNEEQQGWAIEAAKAAGKASYEVSMEQATKRYEQMKEKGMEINEIDLTPLKEAVKPVVEKYCAQSEVCAEVVAAIEEYKAAHANT